ncbi:DNA-binding protein [Vallitalea guaymasensis]|uniref:DNA-binding protein n=1 Tax=Vallitalea guaymasensis TaxID=1185412 RepID=UPI0023556F8D|nr:DNA-binding protein [Vallitalea guaymasensis]
MEYMSVRETATRWGVSERQIQKLCKEERILGAIRFGKSWGIPENTTKPWK